MVQSINTKVDLVVDATSFIDISAYGKVMIGDRGFEFFHARDVKKYVQIPWDEVVRVHVTVFFGGRWIPRYAIETKNDGMFVFASKKSKKVLRLIGEKIGVDNIVHALGFGDVVRRAFKARFGKGE